MRRIVLLSLVKAFLVSFVFYLICMIYGVITKEPYETSLKLEGIFFIVLFLVNLIEYWWRNRKK